ncbi:hypothetical protein MKZ38_000947 [Zalerion maritima]|uniref:PD-(D/E)XK nuclease-like domain-containing protein n=1 Tax=Zalerion maritima TaxID=339359 RepID=A0AAD5RF49_9PEZI|nr:hypothetical protein MKZ38_000947 [Zalerion maritima]
MSQCGARVHGLMLTHRTAWTTTVRGSGTLSLSFDSRSWVVFNLNVYTHSHLLATLIRMASSEHLAANICRSTSSAVDLLHSRIETWLFNTDIAIQLRKPSHKPALATAGAKRKRDCLTEQKAPMPSPPPSTPPADNKKRLKTPDDSKSSDGVNDSNDVFSVNDRTPRAGDTLVLGSIPSIPPSSSTASISSSSARNRSSSPGKRKRTLAAPHNGIDWHPELDEYNVPDAVRDMYIHIAEVTDYSYPFIPARLGQRLVRDYRSDRFTDMHARLIKRLCLDESDEGADDKDNGDALVGAPGCFPDPDQVEEITSKTETAQIDGAAEDWWNDEVHSPLLKMVFRKRPCPLTTNGAATVTPVVQVGDVGGNDRQKTTNKEKEIREGAQINTSICTSAIPASCFLPPLARAQRIDYCLYITPPESFLPQIRRAFHTSTGSINHTDYNSLRTSPICLSIETKRHDGQAQEGELQLGIWLAAHWNSLRQVAVAGDNDVRRLPFLPGVLVVGHQWYILYSICAGERTQIWSRQFAGSSATVIGVYRIVYILRQLARWCLDIYWPWFSKHVLIK